MFTIRQATAGDLPSVRALLTEYMQWAHDGIVRDFGVDFDVGAFVEGEMSKIAKYLPPEGRLLLAEEDGGLLGSACLHPIRPGVAEIKRMYVRPGQRRRGVGRALAQALLDEARAAGYEGLLLDSPPFCAEAHALYRSLGFRDTAPYAETEIPPEVHGRWVFMELALR
jgi:GNAT superfamily N-acetyltransferase